MNTDEIIERYFSDVYNELNKYGKLDFEENIKETIKLAQEDLIERLEKEQSISLKLRRELYKIKSKRGLQ